MTTTLTVAQKQQIELGLINGRIALQQLVARDLEQGCTSHRALMQTWESEVTKALIFLTTVMPTE